MLAGHEQIRTIPSTKRLCERLVTLPREPSNEIGTVDPPRHPVSAGNIEKENTLTYPTQTKLPHHTTSTASNRTAIFDRRRPRVATESIQLQLRLVAHLGGETVVACDVEVCAARDLVVGNALSRFDVAEDACIWSRRHSGGNVTVPFRLYGHGGKRENKQATITDFDLRSFFFWKQLGTVES